MDYTIDATTTIDQLLRDIEAKAILTVAIWQGELRDALTSKELPTQ